MSWRPPEEEWEKLVKENLDWTDRPSLEAGADLILGILKKNAVMMICGGRKIGYFPARPHGDDGYLVFIPDEEKDGKD